MAALKKIKWANVFISLLLIGIGVCIFVWKTVTTSTLCIAIGAAALLFGILKLVSYFVRDVKGVAVNYDFSVGALAVIFGIIMLIHPQNVVELLQVLIGVYLLLDSVFKLQTALDSKRLGVPGWWVTLIFTLVCLALGFMLIFKIEQDMLMTLIGISLIADGLQNLCMVIFSAVAARALEKLDKDGDGVADCVEVMEAEEPVEPEAPAIPAPPVPVPLAPAAESEAAPELPAEPGPTIDEPKINGEAGEIK